MSQDHAKLLIVYNADTGMLNAVMHALHKAIRPQTYPCSLCALTYGAVSMRSSWRQFLAALPLDVAFYHRDDFAEDYPASDPDLPAVLVSENGAAPDVLVSADELNAMDDLEGLMRAVEAKLSEQIANRALSA
jgi:hypothetical protein